MSLSAAIAPFIPLLRRFARALTGTQRSGDAYVAATLETILSDPDAFGDGQSPRVALYRMFLRTWRDFPINGIVDRPAYGREASADRNLGALSVKPRIAFLLSAVEQFPLEDIAQTLECSPDEARSLIDQAGREIADQIRTRVLIIEDEPLIALDIQRIVEQLGHDVTTIARTHTEAVRAAVRSHPGLILADIKLADGSSGLEAVNEILASLEAPVIFITAFPERFLTGQAPEPAFLITKPFSADAVRAVISQALFFDQKSRPAPASAEAGAGAPTR
jgi:DNA-directed RNA polymerase specialized sigma24 family protein